MTTDECPSKSFTPSRNFKTSVTQKSSNVLSLRRGTLHLVAHNLHLLPWLSASTRNKRRLSTRKLWATATVPGEPGFCLRAHTLLPCRFPRLMEMDRRLSPGPFLKTNHRKFRSQPYRSFDKSCTFCGVELNANGHNCRASERERDVQRADEVKQTDPQSPICSQDSLAIENEVSNAVVVGRRGTQPIVHGINIGAPTLPSILTCIMTVTFLTSRLFILTSTGADLLRWVSRSNTYGLRSRSTRCVCFTYFPPSPLQFAKSVVFDRGGRIQGSHDYLVL
jgi:hypothetical protein